MFPTTMRKVHGSLTAHELITIPTSTGNIIELRKDHTTSLSDGEVAGLYIHNVPNIGDNVKIGINKDAELVFHNKINNYHVPIIPSSNLANIPIIGINSNGIIETAELKTIKINTTTIAIASIIKSVTLPSLP